MRRKTLLLVCLFLFLGIGAWLRWYTSPDRIRAEEQSVAPVGDGSKFRAYWGSRIRKDGAKPAYEAVQQLLKDVSYGTQEAGMYYFGTALYEQTGKEGIAICDEAFTYGCSRGYSAAAIAKEGKTVLPDLVNGCKRAFGRKFSSCLHGLGHGVLLALGYDRLEEALAACDASGANEEMGCSSGIFMEYNSRARDARRSMWAREARQEGKKKPLEPCVSLPEQFREACFYGQVRWWHSVYDGNWEKIIGLCERLEGAGRKGCFEGIGNVLPGMLSYDAGSIGKMYAGIAEKEDVSIVRQSAGWITLFETENGKKAVAICSAGDELLQKKCEDGLSASAFWK